MASLTTFEISTLECEVDDRRWIELTAVLSAFPGRVVGKAELEHIGAEDATTLCSLFVHPQVRRFGVATTLVQAAKSWTDSHSKDLYLHVQVENRGARQLYKKQNFQYTGEKTDDGSLWMISPALDGRLHHEVVAKPGEQVNLSTYQVQELREKGFCTWQRDCDAMAPFPYPHGATLWVHESVAKPRQGEDVYLYLADGEQPRRFYHKNYHMPHAARRLRVEVVGSWCEVSDSGQWAHCYTLKLLSDASVSSD